jgi:tetratricopeptide (TPR) repeat protein
LSSALYWRRETEQPNQEVAMRTLPLVLAVFLGSAAAAQHGHPGGEAPKPPELIEGLGDHHFQITTRSPQAQQFFDQGLALLYGFNHDEAARYFHHASTLDPDAAMPYWGLALAIGPNYNDTAVDPARAAATYEAVRQALARAPAASTREQGYVRALAKRYSADPQADWQALHRVYSDAMRELVRQMPDDLDAATMFAESLMMLRPWQLWTLDGQPAPGTLELVAVLESVLKRDPEHPGANHFYIHAVEASANLERALPSAQRLLTLVPAAGHLVHMPGHIYLQTGDYELAAATNVRAAEADRRFVARTGATGMYPLMYWTHNIHFVAYANAQQGSYTAARQAAHEIVDNIGAAADEMQMLEGFLLYPAMIDLRFAKWDAVLATSAPPPTRSLSLAFWRFGRAVALAAQGKLAEAEAERDAFERARRETPAESRYLINNTSADFLTLASHVLAARLSFAQGRTQESVEAWRRAVASEATIQYDEPPAWYYPIRESLGGALLRGRQPREAETVFREALEKAPRDGRLLFGLWQSLLAQDRTGEAALVEARFREAWKEAEVALRIEDL